MVIPPPNVTGVLHMGHMLNNTIQDVLVRRARMQGKNACWVPGTDHASIATEAKVVAKLKEQGIDKSSLTREEFMKHAWEWKEKDPALSEAVINTFVYFYKKGYIYRGVRMVNWDPQALTAVSDDEVIHKETRSKLYYLRYKVSDGAGNPTDDYIVIATTRPETIMADAAVCINPEDPRYHHLRGKKILIPLINREIPIIEDSYVTMDFGTGCLKVTPAHDVNDYEIGLRHNLPVLDIIDDHGRLNEKATILVGEDRFVARKKIVKMLAEAGQLEKEEDYLSPVGHSERTDAVIEPKLSMQWFIKMDELSKAALARVENGEIRLIPDKYRNTYCHWMENTRDWCISRQLWWGQQIPAYYLPDGRYVVEATEEEALKAAQQLDPSVTAADLRRDEDVLDTWFSSWLWPISVFDPGKPGFPEKAPNADLAYYYPTNDLVTAPDIIFFWVARMVMAGNEFMGKVPFHNVYFTGIVRDKLGRKMSKTLGNSPDPLKLIDDYGADGVRIGMLLCTDILFDESQVEQGRNFCNKIWNAYRLVKGWSVDRTAAAPEHSALAVKWFTHKLNQAIATVDDHFSKFRISDALMTLYKLFWDDFCAWYLEIVKPAFGSPVDGATYDATIGFFDSLLKLLHPVMPFITEELWHNIAERPEGATVMLERQPAGGEYDEAFIRDFGLATEAVAALRNIRQKKGISPKEALDLRIKGAFPQEMTGIVRRMGNVGEISFVEDFGGREAGASFLVGTVEMFVPLAGKTDVQEEIAKAEAEIERLEKFLKGVNAKLSNEKFMQNAPEAVVRGEEKKRADATAKIEGLRKTIEALKG